MKKMISLMLAATALLSLTACGNGQSSDPNAPVKVKYSVVFAATGTQADGANRLGELISEKSDGRMTMEFYPSSQLGDKVATMEGLINGSVEMTECAATDLSSFNSMWSVFSLPYLWEDGDQAIATVMDPEVQEVLNADMEANGFKIIAWTNMGSRSVMNDKHAVNSPADMDGLKIRCMEDSVLADAMDAMGCIATPLANSEVYTALQQGTIDGLENTPPVLIASGYEELAKYLSLTEHFTIPDPVFVSKSWFDSLSEENQQALLEAGEAFTQEWSEEIWPSATENALSEMKAAGVTINEVDKASFIEATRGVVENFLSNATDEQKELYDLLTTVQEKY